MHKTLAMAVVPLLFSLFSPPLLADSRRLDDVIQKGFPYRNLGPFRAGGWVSDVAVPETPQKAHLYTF
jgi:hypothetical protein